MFKKWYDAWIASKFNGLSAYTLYQLVSEHFTKEYADEAVYVTLYNYARGVDRSDKAWKLFDALTDLAFDLTVELGYIELYLDDEALEVCKNMEVELCAN